MFFVSESPVNCRHCGLDLQSPVQKEDPETSSG